MDEGSSEGASTGPSEQLLAQGLLRTESQSGESQPLKQREPTSTGPNEDSAVLPSMAWTQLICWQLAHLVEGRSPFEGRIMRNEERILVKRIIGKSIVVKENLPSIVKENILQEENNGERHPPS